jgi:hypothetical protein
VEEWLSQPEAVVDVLPVVEMLLLHLYHNDVDQVSIYDLHLLPLFFAFHDHLYAICSCATLNPMQL